MKYGVHYLLGNRVETCVSMGRRKLRPPIMKCPTVQNAARKPEEAAEAVRTGKITVDAGDSSTWRLFFRHFRTLEQLSEPQA